MNSNSSDIELITYPILNRFENILHFTSTRNGGESTGNYSSFNLGLYSGDEPENITKNFKKTL